MLAPDWTWWDAVPVIGVAVLVLWIPGIVLARGLRARWWTALALAPALSVSLLSAGGMVTEIAGLPWGAAALVVWGLVVPASATALYRLSSAGRSRPLEWGIADLGRRAAVAGLLLAAALVGGILITAARPGDLPNGPDIVSHLGIVRYFLEEKTISSLVADGFNRPSAPGFYPAAFHGVAATVVMLTGAPIIVAETSLLLVAAALVWPLGLIVMVGSLVDRHPLTTLLTGVFAATAMGFPYLLLIYGPLWPLALSFTLIPAMTTLLGVAMSGTSSRARLGPVLTLVLALPGVALAHTSAVFVVLIAGVVLLLSTLTERAVRGEGAVVSRWRSVAVVLALVVLGIVVLALIAPTGMRQTNYGNDGWRAGVVLLLTLWSRTGDAHQVAGALLLALMSYGAFVAFRTRGARWLAVTWTGFLALAFANTVVDAGTTWPLTWPWYNVPARTQAIASVFGAPLAALGASALIRGAARTGRREVLLPATVALLTAVVIGQSWANLRHVQAYYVLVPTNARILPDEVRALMELSELLPDDAVVLTSPWKGGQFLPAIGPEEVFIPTETAVRSDADMMLLGTSIDDVRDDPLVCAVVQRHRVSHVITGGRDSWFEEGRTDPYVGIVAVADTEAFTRIATAGPYTLWQVPDCQR